MSDAIYTIGHSSNSIERFIELLARHAITAVCDVRSTPYSRLNPQFNRETLGKALASARVKYVYLGKELGARSEDKNCYQDGQVQYPLLAQTNLFKQGIERVKSGAATYRVALMCAEKEPLECHRTILISRQLAGEGVSVRHILSDGRLENHEHALKRLVGILKIPGPDMFRPKEAVIEDAYARQAQRIAYREQVKGTSVSDEATPQSASGAVD
jgi:uncharacterized protein (DUF488 family)